jgi:hypothetical protein
MNGITNPQLDSKKPNYYTSESKEQEEKMPNQEKTYITNHCWKTPSPVTKVKKLVTKQTISTEMSKKNKKELKLLKEENRERERDHKAIQKT